MDLIATKADDRVVMLIYNYIDPEIVTGYLSRNIATLNGSQRKALLNLIASDKLQKIMLGELEISKMRLSKKSKALLKKAQELNDRAIKFKSGARNVKLVVKNLKENYLYQRYVVDSSCSINCAFTPVEEKELNLSAPHTEALKLNPYSVNMIVLTKKPAEPKSAEAVTTEQPAAQNIEKVDTSAEAKEKVP